MEVFDSRQHKLDHLELLQRVAAQDPDDSLPLEGKLLAFVKEMSMPNTSHKQIGNTFFVLHRGTGERRTVGVLQAHNIDTAMNAVENFYQYLKFAQQNGLRQIVSRFQTDKYIPLARFLERKLRAKTRDSGVSVAKATDRELYELRVILGKDEL